MSTEKNISMIFRLAKEDKQRIKELSNKLECSESYLLRIAVKQMFEREFTNKEQQ